MMELRFDQGSPSTGHAMTAILMYWDPNLRRRHAMPLDLHQVTINGPR